MSTVQGKQEQFSTQNVELANYARALAHPARIAIVKLLARRDACVCGEIVSDLPLAQSTVSQHLKELKKVGLVKGRVEGVKVCYCLDPTAFARMEGLMAELFTEFKEIKELPCC